jgi:hypothetical protein
LAQADNSCDSTFGGHPHERRALPPAGISGSHLFLLKGESFFLYPAGMSKADAGIEPVFMPRWWRM